MYRGISVTTFTVGAGLLIMLCGSCLHYEGKFFSLLETGLRYIVKL